MNCVSLAQAGRPLSEPLPPWPWPASKKSSPPLPLVLELESPVPPVAPPVPPEPLVVNSLPVGPEALQAPAETAATSAREKLVARRRSGVMGTSSRRERRASPLERDYSTLRRNS